MVDRDRLLAAYGKARDDLLAERSPDGHWIGALSSSPLSTATAISALVLAEQHGRRSAKGFDPDQVYQINLAEQIVKSLHWLAARQNDDGGWGDTDKSASNIATTLLVQAAFHLTGVPVKYAGLLERADAYVAKAGGWAGLRRRYGRDKTFAVPILTNCALAGMIPWKRVPSLPFELACFPQRWYRFLRLPVVSYAIPALVAIGQARYFHRRPLNPIAGLIRGAAVEPSLRVLGEMQPESGGFLEATPLTSFVVMSLASVGRADSPIVRQGVEFLLSSVRPDGSWPIDSNLATWNTTLALNALASSGEPIRWLDTLPWLLACQHRRPHRFTGAEPGGWAWTDLTGGVPDADDTPGALLALAAHWDEAVASERTKIETAATSGIRWLLGLQNSDGGWATFCRGWGKLPFDRSGADLTAHALRALRAWRGKLAAASAELGQRIDGAVERGFNYLTLTQRPDGSWLPLWFGNQHLPGEENPIYGTAKVLLAFRDFGRMDRPAARRGVGYLLAVQQPSGGWGGGPAAVEKGFPEQAASIEETGLAVEALLDAGREESLQVATAQGVAFLVQAVEENRHRIAAPIGFYFARLWYHERLYPYIAAVSALGQALVRDFPQPGSDDRHREDGNQRPLRIHARRG